MQRPNTLNFHKLEEEFLRAGLDALVAASGENVLYLSGLPSTYVLGSERIALVVWYPEGKPTFIVCNVDESLAKEMSWITDVRSYVEFAQSPVQLLAEVLLERGLRGRTVGIEKKFLTAAQHEELMSLLRTTNFVPADQLFDSVRAIKTDQEVALLTKAANIAEEAIHWGFTQARTRATEKAVLDSMTAYSRARGADPLSSILGSGPNTGHVHCEAGPRELQRGDLVRVDFCGLYKGYYYDVARTAAVAEPTPSQSDTYRRLWKAQRQIIGFLAPGVRASDVYARAQQAFEEEGLRFSFPHVGHGLGIGIHEEPMMQPYDERELEPNMTVCIEPFYLAEDGCGYHVEDLVRITDSGTEIISNLYDNSEIAVIADQRPGTLTEGGR